MAMQLGLQRWDFRGSLLCRTPVSPVGPSGHAALNVLLHFLFPFLSFPSPPLLSFLLLSSPLFSIQLEQYIAPWLYIFLSFLHGFRFFLSIFPLHSSLLPEAFLFSGHDGIRYIIDPWSCVVCSLTDPVSSLFKRLLRPRNGKRLM